MLCGLAEPDPVIVALMGGYYRALVSRRDAEALDCLIRSGLPPDVALDVFKEDCRSPVVARRREHG